MTRRKNARRDGAGNGAARRLRRALVQAGGTNCARCGQWEPSLLLEVDHVVELADGGQDVEDNLQVLCRPCHLIKTTTAREARR